ncbi:MULTISPECIES: MG2 domain-containing protein [unclassified Rhizobium]|uniref:alpha-2-macroglobulin n=1 Tax=unclassified Rhizobium TaxID=2613769 RepID=UPI000CDF3874|nr:MULTISPECIES: MG2 domain-containing protein [Rhizobium]AVA26357.1 alpha-2-macroglobulin domain-containing protein [Rhizobium sp. NXC24]UWU24013.1 MG2 domain-containing protein [Rhizobium tropici]
MKKIVFLIALALASSTLISSSHAQQSANSPTLDVLQRADGVKIVPEKFLRAYDPVTIFFPTDTGPATGGPEDSPERFVTMEPAAAGAWQWLGPRALQFRPADKWQPLARVKIKMLGHEKDAGTETELIPLLPVPVSTVPAAAGDPVNELDQITLTFAEPVDVAALSRLLSIELRPAPGIGDEGGLMLGAQDFDIQPLERNSRSDQQSYMVKLHASVPDGRVAILRLKLADTPDFSDQTFELRVRTAVPFTMISSDCGRGFDATTSDGIMRCTSNATVSDSGGAVDDNGNPVDDADAAPATRSGEARGLIFRFSSNPVAGEQLSVRDSLRISPPVDDLTADASNGRLYIHGRFLTDKIYTLDVAAGALTDDRGRPLATGFSRKFAFAPEQASLVWDASQGVVERFGPQLVPLRGRGYDRADVRIHAIDPLSRDFWPFPQAGLDTNDDEAPPLPGKEPQKWAESDEISADAIQARVKALGSPAISQFMDLPIHRGGVDTKFGLDLKSSFARIAGADQPGTYLVGLRAVDSQTRHWLRVQVTDLTLSAVEEQDRVRFAVTSLAKGNPIDGAQIRLDGLRDGKFVTLATGTTDAQGFFSWELQQRAEAKIRRVIVTKGLDTLVIDPDNAPAQYAQDNWTKPSTSWLDWTTNPEENRAEQARTLCHVFTERPIYRPEEPVHIKGYVRSYLGGHLTLPTQGGQIVITGPDKQEWRVPVKLDAFGDFYHKFDAETPATGDYKVHFEPGDTAQATDQAQPEQKSGNDDENADDQPSDSNADDGQADDAQADSAQTADSADSTDDAADNTTQCGSISFKKEAYRLPTFEVVLNNPQTVPLDSSFNVDLIARYFAGGLLADRPIRWRAVQYPYNWTPPGHEGFLFSTDSRYSGSDEFKSSPALERDGSTDAGGASRISFDTTIEPTAQPRRYMIEATVTGDDDLQVRSITNVYAVPPFVLGLKVPRYVPKLGAIEPEILAVDGNGHPVAGLEMTARLIHRNWTSTLQASDFSQGSAKYVTQEMDETVLERKITSTKDIQTLALEANDAGVYIIQLEASDRIGRRQQVSVDFFVGGTTPVTWAQAPARTAVVTTDKDSYIPGETANLLIQSPFQTARALAVVEEPEGKFRYDWVDIADGYGHYALPVRKEYMPEIPVHFLIMRGRLETSIPSPNAPFDQGKPVTIAATKTVTVKPVKNTVTVTMDYPKKARPGDEVEVTLHLADDTGQPIAGDATFWMVDQAVLSLATEQPLDPLPNFIVKRQSTMALRDTRNMAFGIIPLDEVPGGDEREDWGTDNNISVRKNFTPVPIYLPDVKVGPGGTAKIKVKLPDSLTVFKLRAKAVSGPDRFGYGTGEMLIRQEIVAQPALPRFLRYGDQFEAGVIARIVEGGGGAGAASIVSDGLTFEGNKDFSFNWEQNKPAHIGVLASVPEPKPGKDDVRLRFGVERVADHARDSVEIALPLKFDRVPIKHYEIVEIPAGGSKTLSTPQENVRPGSFQRVITLASDPALVKLVAGLNTLVESPYGSTEQRISLASSSVAFKSFEPILAAAKLDKRIDSDVHNTVLAISQAVDADGLVGFWPHSKGNVSLTAWAYSFLVAAEKAGEPTDKALTDRLASVLKLSLRSDYPHLLTGDEIRERVEALTALAEGGKLDPAYTAELARSAALMPNVSVARMTAAAAAAPDADPRLVGGFADAMWSRVRILSRDGQLVYNGQAQDGGNPIILPSETRSLAEMVRAAALTSETDPRYPALKTALLRLGEGDGWGSTNATSAAIRALSAAWQRPTTPLPLTLSQNGSVQTLTLDANTPVLRQVTLDPGAITISNTGSTSALALVETSYLSAEAGYKAQAQSQGFALTRTLYRVPAGNAPLEKLAPDANGAIQLKVGDVLEERVELVVSEDRTHVALTLPLAAGLDPLNPNIATAPAEATPAIASTLPTDWVSYGDDQVFCASDRLPKGNYTFAYRTRALIAGSYTQPQAFAETMYQKGVQGMSAAVQIVVAK